MTWLVRLYPAKWRERYGEEFKQVLTDQRPSLGMFIDVLAGAFDAHFHPQTNIKQSATQGDAMTDEMLKRCATGGPVLSQREQMTAGLAMLVGTLILAAAYVVLRKIYHATPAVEGLGYTILPATLLFYVQMGYLRRWTLRTQFLLTGGALGFLFLIMWGACLLAALIEPVGRHHF